MSEIFKESWQALRNGETNLALSFLPQEKYLETPQKRERAHIIAKTLLINGHFSQALKVLQQTRRRNGDHISLLFDECTCYYHLNDFYNFELKVQEIQNVLDQIHELLSAKSKFNAFILLAKFQEERGHIAAAYRIYKNCLGFAPSERLDIVKCQLLRLECQYDLGRDHFDHYYRLKTKYEQSEILYAKIEEIHALLLYEAQLFGVDAAVNQLQKLYAIIKNELHDWELVLFDILEISLRKEAVVNEQLRSLLALTDPQTDFQRTLKQLAENKNIEEWELFPDKYSPDSLLKLSHLLSKSDSVTQNYRELARQMKNLFLQKLPEKEILAWHRYFGCQESSATPHSIALINTHSIKINDQVFDLSSQKILPKFISLFQQQESISVDQAINEMWNVNYDLSYYSRVKRITHRINGFFKIHGFPPLLSTSKEKITLSDAYKFR